MHIGNAWVIPIKVVIINMYKWSFAKHNSLFLFLLKCDIPSWDSPINYVTCLIMLEQDMSMHTYAEAQREHTESLTKTSLITERRERWGKQIPVWGQNDGEHPEMFWVSAREALCSVKQEKVERQKGKEEKQRPSGMLCNAEAALRYWVYSFLLSFTKEIHSLDDSLIY